MKNLNLWVFFILLIIVISLSYKMNMIHYNKQIEYTKLHIIKKDTIKPIPLIKIQDTISLNSFTEFKDFLGFKESSLNYNAINTYGYLGKYQFGKSALKDIGIKRQHYNKFLKSPKIQEKSINALLSINKFRLRKYIAKYQWKEINGILITEAGLLAAAHLVGSNNVKKYLKSNGTYVKKDGYGTTIEEYLKEFALYDLSIIEAKRSVKVYI